MKTAYSSQLPLDLAHRPAQGREDFLVTPSNQDAVSWIDKWPNWNAPALVIYGPAASGKSHLAAVWGDKTSAAHVDMNLLVSETANDISKLSKHLVMEGLDLWIGDETAEKTVFHLYNIMKEEGGSLLITMAMAPTHIDFCIADLASRLRAAPAAAIQPPDDDLLAAIIMKLFSDRQITIGKDVLDYLLPRMERSFAAAHEIVAAADHLALAEKKKVTVPLMRRVLMAR